MDNAEAELEEKEVKIWAELVQVLDKRSVMLIRRDCRNKGSKAYKMLCEHYRSTDKPRIMSMMSKLTGLRMNDDEQVEDYLIRAEELSYGLEDAGQTVAESMLISLILKGLPESFEQFVTIQNCSKDAATYEDIKKDLISYVNHKTERNSASGILKHEVASFSKGKPKVFKGKCFKCGLHGHMSKD